MPRLILDLVHCRDMKSHIVIRICKYKLHTSRITINLKHYLDRIKVQSNLSLESFIEVGIRKCKKRNGLLGTTEDSNQPKSQPFPLPT